MPLSDHEQRLLEQMERALLKEDPKLAVTLRGQRSASRSRRRLLLAACGFLAGIALLIAGVASQLVIVSVLGFIAMLAGAFVGVTGGRISTQIPSDISGVFTVGPGPTGKGRKSRSTSFGERFEERWRRRREGDGR